MDSDRFHQLVESAYERLPEYFQELITNAIIVVEDYPDDEIVRTMKLGSRKHLLGLYQGVPLTKRNTNYGMTAVIPDKITLFQKNIEAACSSEQEIDSKVTEVLIHEIAHHFGMNEEEVRAAGY
ncbi:MAG: metallopeptidase family protein [Ignavibacteriae bacterium]|nr:metallopeptidase family protein [Ignavibacteriota bacterium]